MFMLAAGSKGINGPRCPPAGIEEAQGAFQRSWFIGWQYILCKFTQAEFQSLLRGSSDKPALVLRLCTPLLASRKVLAASLASPLLVPEI